MTNAERLNSTSFGRLQRGASLTGVIAMVACAAAATSNPASFLPAYLAAYMFYLGLALGSLVLLMAYHLTGGSWGFVIRRTLEAATRTLPLMVVAFLVIPYYGLEHLYIWARPEDVAASAKLQYQQFYLQPNYFLIRAACYFVAWLSIAWLLSYWSRKEDETGNPRLALRCLRLSAVGAVIYGITIYFASVDWTMSIEPVFHSTIWGPLTASGQLLSALALAIFVLRYAARRAEVAEVFSTKVVNDLASLLFTLLILWCYMVWCQFMLVWIANLPVDVIWYIPRASLGWKVVIGAIAVFHFAIPFILLLMRPIKRNVRRVAGIAAILLFMQLVFNYYQIMPNFPGETLIEHWIDFVAPIGLGGLWLAEFLRQLDKRPLLPLNDYNRAAALHLRELDAEEAAREEAIAYD